MDDNDVSIVGSLILTNEPFVDNNVDSGESDVCWETEGIWELCILSLSEFCCKPKSTLKYKVC